MKNILTILVIEDNAGDRSIIRDLLLNSGISSPNIILKDCLPEACQVISRQPVDLILCAIDLLGIDGNCSFKSFHSMAKHTPTIILTGQDTCHYALEMMRKGASDCQIKEHLDKESLVRSIEFCLEKDVLEKKMKENDEKLALLSKVTHEVLWEWDLTTNKIIRDDKQLREAYGLDLNSVHNNFESWLHLIHHEDRNKIKSIINEIRNMDEKDVYEIEYRVSKGDGTYINIYDRGIIIRDQNAQPVKVLGVGQNITVSKKAEDQLKLSEEKFKLIFDNNPFPILVYDADTLQFLEVNKTALKVYGYTKDEFINMTGTDIRPKEERELFISDVQKIIYGGRPHKKIRTHLKKNGQKIIVEVTSYMLDFFGKRAILALINDITQETRLKEELEKHQFQRKKEITKAMFKAEEKERTAIGLELHDNVNQLLASARLYNELAIKSQELQQEYARKCIELIDYAISEIRKLSQALIVPNFTKKGLIHAVEDIATLLKMSRGIKVEVNTGAFNESKLDQGRKLTIYRIVQEQLNNIIKHAKATLVQVNLSLNGNEVKLIIKDNGSGFDPRKKRTGVGLSNIESRASFYNGQMEVFSKPGEGCTLQVTFLLND